jgi:hypothetical protein
MPLVQLQKRLNALLASNHPEEPSADRTDPARGIVLVLH